jgi:hypothetical protein
MTPKTAEDVTATQRNAPRVADPAADLQGLDAERWPNVEAESRNMLLEDIDTHYKFYLKTFYDTSNDCVTRHDKFIRRHRIWRHTAIVGTGLLACLNFLAAKRSLASAWWSALPIAASLGALLLSVLANLETFANSAEHAQAYRESRESYLDAAQEYDRAWSVTVVALGNTAQAYLNAVELYKRIIAADRDLRRSFKEVNKHRGQ